MKTGAYKRQLRRIRRSNGLYAIMFERLSGLPKNKAGVIRFPHVFHCLCGSFHIEKPRCWDLLMMLHEFGVIEIVPFHGIRIITR